MGNIIFSSEIISSNGQQYKIDLFSESYIGFNAAIIGGSGAYYYFAGDWTDFLTLGQNVRLFEGIVVSGNRVVASFTYNEAQNRTEVRFTVGSYQVLQTSAITLDAAPTFAPRLLDIHTDWETEGDIILESIKASSTTIIYANRDAWFDRFIDMYIESNDNELKLIVYREDTGWQLDWVGNIVIDLVEWDNAPKPIPFLIKAIDGLNKLKDIRYNEVATSPTEVRLKEHIYNLLAKNDLNQFWGATDAYLRESIEYKSNEVIGTLSTAHSPLDYCYISDRMFINKEPNNSEEGITCYDALRGILELFNCRIFISKGVYYIQQVRNYGSVVSYISYREYSKTMGSYAASTYNYKIQAGGVVGGARTEALSPKAGGKFSYLAGLYRVSMDVKTNSQSQYPLPLLSVENGQNPDTFTETFDVYGGVGKGAVLNYGFDVYARYGAGVTGASYYLDLDVVLSVTDGASTYYYTGGKGLRRKWTTSSASFGYDIKGMKRGEVKKFTLETTEIPLKGTLTLTVTATFRYFTGAIATPVAGTEPYQVFSRLLIPLGEGSDNDSIYVDNITSGYTKELHLPPLVITDKSNATSINVISVKEDYLTTNTTLVETITWDAGFDQDHILTETRILEAMSLQYKPISRYLGSFEGEYYPQFTILYNNKNYFFNGFSKNYLMDEVEGEWVEETNQKAGFTPIDYTTETGEGEIYTGDGGQGSVMALLDNNHTVSTIDSAQAAGTVTSLSIVASGLSQSVVKGDKILVIDPVTNGIVEEFTVAADLSSSATTLSVNSKTTTQDIEAGMVFQVAKETIFEKLNIASMANKDYMLEVASGNIAGVSSVNKFGANEDVASGTEEDVWDAGGIYTFPLTADITQIRQSVTQVAMQGATIEVQGLDVNWDLVIQTVDLDAADTTTPMPLDTPLRRVFRMRVLENIVATQNIIATNAGLTVTYARITPTNNQTEMAIYTVPSGYTAYITSYYCDYVKVTGKDPTSIDFYLWMADRANNYAFQIKHSKGIPQNGSGFQHFFQPYFKVTEKTDIKISALSNGAAAHVHAGFDIVLVENA